LMRMPVLLSITSVPLEAVGLVEKLVVWHRHPYMPFIYERSHRLIREGAPNVAPEPLLKREGDLSAALAGGRLDALVSRRACRTPYAFRSRTKARRQELRRIAPDSAALRERTRNDPPS
jgi:hypothetical protein